MLPKEAAVSTPISRPRTSMNSRALRAVGAIALFGIAGDHLYELVVAAPTERLLGARRGKIVLPLVAAGGMALAAGSLAGLVIAESRPLFGFMEFGHRSAIVVAIVCESVAVLDLAALVAVQARDLLRGVVEVATMTRSRNHSLNLKVGWMTRLLIALIAAAGIAAGVAGVAGAFSSGPRPVGAAAAASSPTPMVMSSTSAVAAGPLRSELHRSVVRVTIMNFAFAPARVVVSPGTRIVWTNEDSDPHTVTTDRPGFSSQALDTGQRYSHTLRTLGSYPYHCTIHPFMHGLVVVKG
jgi:plastocyanin